MEIRGVDVSKTLLPKPKVPSAGDREVERLGKAAQEFEALILERLIKEMRTSGPGAEESSDPASGTLDDFGATALSGVMSKTRNFGLANALVQAMEAQVRALAANNEGGGQS